MNEKEGYQCCFCDEVNMDKITESIRNICKKALDGHIDVDEFYSSWPEEATSNEFFNQVHDDLEDGIEHLPGFFLKKGVDYESWIDSSPYLTIYIDYILLELEISSSDMLRYRSIVMQGSQLSKEIIEKTLKECLEKSSKK